MNTSVITRCLLVLIILFSFIKLNAQNIDVSILRSVYKNETTFKDIFFKADAQSVTIVNIGMPASIFVVGIEEHSKVLKRNAIFIAGAYIMSSIVTQSLKVVIKRARPFVAYPQYFSDRYDGGGYSFPSGHTSAAFCSATSLSLYFPKWYVIVPSYFWAASVGWARMYEGVHYPSDVFMGAVVGTTSAWICYKVEQRINKKRPIQSKRFF